MLTQNGAGKYLLAYFWANVFVVYLHSIHLDISTDCITCCGNLANTSFTLSGNISENFDFKIHLIGQKSSSSNSILTGSTKREKYTPRLV